MKIARVSLYLDARYTNTDGKHQLKLRVYHNGTPKLWELPGHLYTKDEYTRLMNSERATRQQYLIRDELLGYKARASDIVKDLAASYSPRLFEDQMFGEVSTSTGLKAVFDRYIKESGEQRVDGGLEPLKTKTVDGYESTYNSLIEFNPKLKQLEEITKTTLSEYQRWMDSRGRSKTTINIYMRCLRAVFNWEISEGRLNRALYPFGRSKSKFQIPAGAKRKLAVGMSVIDSIIAYNPHPGYVNKGRDFWVLTYLLNGMNMTDILRIREGDFLKENELHFVREKTRTTSREERFVRVVVVPLAWEIINRWATRKLDPEAYLFDVLEPGITEAEERRRIENFTRVVNNHFKKMLKAMGLPEMTTYWARHSFGTMLRNANISTSKIQIMYGHGSLSTTETYLGEMDVLEQEAIMKNLLSNKAG